MECILQLMWEINFRKRLFQNFKNNAKSRRFGLENIGNFPIKNVKKPGYDDKNARFYWMGIQDKSNGKKPEKHIEQCQNIWDKVPGRSSFLF